MHTIKQTLCFITLFTIFGISFKFEFEAYSHFLQQMTSSVNADLWPAVVAFTFNAGKLLLFKAIVEHKNLGILKLWKHYLALTGLILNSFMCAFCVMSYSLESANIDVVLADQKAKAQAQYDSEVQVTEQKNTLLSQQLLRKYEANIAQINAAYQPQIDKYDTELTLEMDDKNSVTGVFIDKEYRAIQDKLTAAQASKKREVDAASSQYNMQVVGLSNQLTKQLNTLSQTYLDSLALLTVDNLQNSGIGRIHSPLITKSLNVFNRVSQSNIDYMYLIAFVSLLMAVIVESLAFSLIQTLHLSNVSLHTASDAVANRSAPSDNATPESPTPSSTEPAQPIIHKTPLMA